MRRATITRKTNETEITVSVDARRHRDARRCDGIGFFDHMLEQVARHSLIDLEIRPRAIFTSTCTIRSRIPASRSARRCARHWASAGIGATPTSSADGRDADARCDRRVWTAVSGLQVGFPTPKIGEFDTELVREFFQAFAMNAGITLHVETLYGANSHHIAESCFKGLARALRVRSPSTRGAKTIFPRPRVRCSAVI